MDCEISSRLDNEIFLIKVWKLIRLHKELRQYIFATWVDENFIFDGQLFFSNFEILDMKL